jgi:hypothetical protein
MEDFLKFILEDALVLVPALYIIGVFLKKTPNVPDWTIPWVLLVGGIGGSVALLGMTPHAVIQGVLVTGGAVLGHQLYKQTAKQE